MIKLNEFIKEIEKGKIIPKFEMEIDNNKPKLHDKYISIRQFFNDLNKDECNNSSLIDEFMSISYL